MVQAIQIKNANKIFKVRMFKMVGHDFLRVFDSVKSKISMRENKALIRLDNKLRQKYGDYEVFVEVLHSKIRIHLLEEFD